MVRGLKAPGTFKFVAVFILMSWLFVIMGGDEEAFGFV